MSLQPEAEQRAADRDICENHGNRTRDFRNGLGLAVPSADQLDWSRIAFERAVADDEIDLDSGFLILPRALLEKPGEPASTDAGGDQGTDDTGHMSGAGKVQDDAKPGGEVPPVGVDDPEIPLSFMVDRDALFNAWNALANLADVAGEVSISARAKPKSGFDKSKLENGVLEPLRELGLIKDDSQD